MSSITITALLTALGAKIGLQVARGTGFLPRSTYIHEALRALKQDDLDKAVSSYLLAVKRWPRTDKTDITHEILCSELNVRLEVLNKRLNEIRLLLNSSIWSLRYWKYRLFLNSSRVKLHQEEKELSGAVNILMQLRHKVKNA